MDRWTLLDTPLHRRDARVKIAAALTLLTATSLSRNSAWLVLAAFHTLVLGGALWARLPLHGVVQRAAAVLPFALVFALGTLAGGDGASAAAILYKSHISALIAILLAASTPLGKLLEGLRRLGMPRFLLMVTQMVYRYLGVTTGEAGRMRTAAGCRGGARFMDAASLVAALFVRSYARAGRIHQAMTARGFSGTLPAPAPTPLTLADAALAGGIVLFAAALLIWSR